MARRSSCEYRSWLSMCHVRCLCGDDIVVGVPRAWLAWSYHALEPHLIDAACEWPSPSMMVTVCIYIVEEMTCKGRIHWERRASLKDLVIAGVLDVMAVCILPETLKQKGASAIPIISPCDILHLPVWKYFPHSRTIVGLIKRPTPSTTTWGGDTYQKLHTSPVYINLSIYCEDIVNSADTI